MSIIFVVFIGLLTGWLVAAAFEFDEGMFSHMGLGVIGAIIGGMVPHLLSGPATHLFRHSWYTVLWSAFGALLVSGIAGLILKPDKNSGA